MNPSIYRVVVLIVAVFLAACSTGGGSGGDGGTQSEGTPQAREEAFAEEAVFRALDRARVDCTELICEGDGIHDEVVDAVFGNINAGCQQRCLRVEVSGEEARHYWTWLVWRRLPDTCYERNEYEVILLAEVPVPCVEDR